MDEMWQEQQENLSGIDECEQWHYEQAMRAETLSDINNASSRWSCENERD